MCTLHGWSFILFRKTPLIKPSWSEEKEDAATSSVAHLVHNEMLCFKKQRGYLGIMYNFDGG